MDICLIRTWRERKGGKGGGKAEGNNSKEKGKGKEVKAGQSQVNTTTLSYGL